MDITLPLAALAVSLLIITAGLAQVTSPPVPREVTITEAETIARAFLDGHNRTTGRLLYSALETRMPNHYWHDAFGIDWMPYVDRPVLVWFFRFEKATNLGHFYEVWVGMRGTVLGGTQCM